MGAVDTDRLQHLRSQGEGTAPLGCLGLGHSGFAIHHDQRVADPDTPAGQVHIRPAQAQQLAPTQPEGREQQPGGIQPILTDRREEGPNLRRRPGVHLDPPGAGRAGLSGTFWSALPGSHHWPRTSKSSVVIGHLTGRPIAGMRYRSRGTPPSAYWPTGSPRGIGTQAGYRCRPSSRTRRG